MKSFVRISALLWADIFVEFALFVLQDYLTGVWNLSFTHSAAIINFWGGISNLLPVCFLFFVDIVLGNFGALVISSISYSLGIGFIAMSTPPILAGATKTCRNFEAECIGNTQKSLLYSGLVFVAIGMAGNMVSVQPFLNEQNEEEPEANSGKTLLKLIPYSLVVIIALAGGIGIPYIKPWSLRFGIPAIFTVLATILFLTGWCTYHKAPLNGSPITSVIKVYIASVCNICKPFPLDTDLYKGYDGDYQTFTRTRGLRCLEKAAIKSDDNEWKQCSVLEVEEAKIAVRMIPMWLTFIICGIVSSTGNTYFVEQAKNMNPRVGKLRVPQQIFLLIFKAAKAFFSGVAQIYLNDSELEDASSSGRVEISSSKKKGYASSIGIALAMIFSILCCIAAAGIEKLRLNAIRRHHLLDLPDKTIPMSIFWLTLQFIFLAGLDSFLENSISSFYRYQSPDSMINYLEYFAKFVSGLGFMCSVLAVYVVGEVSKKVGSKSNWFQSTLNRSRLDLYYWVLAVLSSLNLIIFVIVAATYTYKNPTLPDNNNNNEDDNHNGKDGDSNDESYS